jgi:ribosomal protein S18 acetylase RimI-like enzyme
LAEPTQVKADIIGYSSEYSAVVRSWINSEETYFNVCRRKDFPPPDDIVDSWQKPDVASYILFSENRPVAYGELWNRSQEMAVEIAHLLVDPFKRSRGYGTKMLQLLYERVTQRSGVGQVVLNLFSDSEEILGCCLKAGFEVLATSPHTVGLRMVRLIR